MNLLEDAVENLLNIIHEDAELLVLNKPAGLVCHPSKNGPLSSLIGRLRLHLGDGSHPHLVNRLDRETSGVTLAAKTDDSAPGIAPPLGKPRGGEGISGHRSRLCPHIARNH